MISEEDIERSELYRLFANLFMEQPSNEMVAHVRDMFQLEFDETLEEIRRDFNNIFGVGKKLPPFESLYNYPLGDSPRLWGKAAEDVQSLYNSAGLMIDEETGLAPDHISVEFLFMSYLIENQMYDLQVKFIENHLLKWIPDYCDAIQKHAETEFYKVIANMVKEFILSEYEDYP